MKLSKGSVLALLVLATITTAAAQVSVSSPSNGATVSNPVRFVASATGSSTITTMKIYVDHTEVYKTSGNKLDTSLTLADGGRYVVVQAWDSSGNVYKTPLNITVSSSAGVTVNSPTPDSSVSTGVRFVASAKSDNGHPISSMSIYVDHSRVYQIHASSLDTTLTLNTGTRKISVQAWDTSGKVYKNLFSISVSSTSSSTIPDGATTYSRIEEMSGWESCDKCAGHDGDGPSTPYSMTQGRSSPSIDGNSTEFWLGGDTAYANALWWKQLGGNSSARNFVYDLYFYLKDSDAPQALEFDVNQSVNGKKYIFGTECDIKGSKNWRVWDTAGATWISTGIHCAVPTSFTWHRLTFEFQRTTGDKVKFISITINGTKHFVNKEFSPRSVNASEINVAFQMDGNGKQTDYSVWLDKVSLSYW